MRDLIIWYKTHPIRGSYCANCSLIPPTRNIDIANIGLIDQILPPLQWVDQFSLEVQETAFILGTYVTAGIPLSEFGVRNNFQYLHN